MSCMLFRCCYENRTDCHPRMWSMQCRASKHFERSKALLQARFAGKQVEPKPHQPEQAMDRCKSVTDKTRRRCPRQPDKIPCIPKRDHVQFSPCAQCTATATVHWVIRFSRTWMAESQFHLSVAGALPIPTTWTTPGVVSDWQPIHRVEMTEYVPGKKERSIS